MHWQKASGYNIRSKVEASIGRYKRVIGDALKSRADDRRKAEVAIAVKALNRMRELGQAQFISPRMITKPKGECRPHAPPCNKAGASAADCDRRSGAQTDCG